eukprot:1139967-Pelagomonas_calceolata.AAC.8
MSCASMPDHPLDALIVKFEEACPCLDGPLDYAKVVTTQSILEYEQGQSAFKRALQLSNKQILHERFYVRYHVPDLYACPPPGAHLHDLHVFARLACLCTTCMSLHDLHVFVHHLVLTCNRLWNTTCMSFSQHINLDDECRVRVRGECGSVEANPGSDRAGPGSRALADFGGNGLQVETGHCVHDRRDGVAGGDASCKGRLLSSLELHADCTGAWAGLLRILVPAANATSVLGLAMDAFVRSVPSGFAWYNFTLHFACMGMKGIMKAHTAIKAGGSCLSSYSPAASTKSPPSSRIKVACSFIIGGLLTVRWVLQPRLHLLNGYSYKREPDWAHAIGPVIYSAAMGIFVCDGIYGSAGLTLALVALRVADDIQNQ